MRQCLIVESLWAMTISVVDSLIVLSDSWIIFSEILSSELVASSKISILGFTIIDLAKEILCLSPPEREVTRFPTKV